MPPNGRHRCFGGSPVSLSSPRHGPWPQQLAQEPAGREGRGGAAGRTWAPGSSLKTQRARLGWADARRRPTAAPLWQGEGEPLAKPGCSAVALLPERLMGAWCVPTLGAKNAVGTSPWCLPPLVRFTLHGKISHRKSC